MQVILSITELQASILLKYAEDNFPAGLPQNVKDILEFIISQTTENERRNNLIQELENVSSDELEALFANYVREKEKTAKQPIRRQP